MCLRRLSEAVYAHNSLQASSRVGMRRSRNRADSVAWEAGSREMKGAVKQCVFRRLREGQEGAVEEARLTPASSSSGRYGTGGSLTFHWRWADDRAVPGTVRMLATPTSASGARNGWVTSEKRRDHLGLWKTLAGNA